MSSKSTEGDYYQLPESTDRSIRRMWIGLLTFFLVITGIVIVVMWQAQNIARAIPFSAEQRFVRPYESALTRLVGDRAKGSPVIEAYLRDLGARLMQAMELDPSIKITIHYLDIDETNAFATLGGHIFVLSGLLKSMPDENSLAMVLAHEIAHIQQRDPAASMSRGMALQMAFGFATGGSADITEVFGNLGQSLYSRKQENVADLEAIRALNSLYGHVAGYRTFFEAIEQQYEEDGIEEQTFDTWFASHPSIQERLNTLEQEKIRIGAELDKTVALPERVIERL